jgi:photosystem II PsbY protein
MDWRLLVVLLPIILAGSWAIFNIGKAALGQIQMFLNREA